MKIITISREFGSGGRELGKRLADALGFAYYDKEIISAIAKESSFDENYVEELLQRGLTPTYSPTFGHSFSLGFDPIMENELKVLHLQQTIIKGLAEKGDCVNGRPYLRYHSGGVPSHEDLRLCGYGLQAGPLSGKSR